MFVLSLITSKPHLCALISPPKKKTMQNYRLRSAVATSRQSDNKTMASKDLSDHSADDDRKMLVDRQL